MCNKPINQHPIYCDECLQEIRDNAAYRHRRNPGYSDLENWIWAEARAWENRLTVALLKHEDVTELYMNYQKIKHIPEMERGENAL
jgi:hypothetical protein